MRKKVRPLVDNSVFDLAATFLNDCPKFESLRDDIREDTRWELADRIQRAIEDYFEEQKLDE